MMISRTPSVAIALALGLAIGSPAGATTTEREQLVDPDGINNPEELSLNYFVKQYEAGHIDPMASIHGYMAAKSGDYRTARRILSRQAAAGNAQAMIWMSWLMDNGLGGPEDPAGAAFWDKKAADAGSPIGALNYGLDLLRGRGVPMDRARGEAFIRRSAEDGDPMAKSLIDHDFDLDVVTPDADNWKYNPYAF